MKDFFILALSNLRRRKLRSWLTMIGIFIGIAAVVALMSLGQGLQNYINEEFEKLGSDKIIIQSKGMGPPGTAYDDPTDRTDPNRRPPLPVNPDTDAIQVVQLAHIHDLRDVIHACLGRAADSYSDFGLGLG